MISNLAKWGNSLALRIPAAMANEIGLKDGGAVDVSVEGGAVIVRPASAHEYNLDILLNGVTAGNIHRETASGQAVGHEY